MYEFGSLKQKCNKPRKPLMITASPRKAKEEAKDRTGWVTPSKRDPESTTSLSKTKCWAKQ